VPVAIAALVYLALSPRIARDDRHVLYGGPNPRVLALSDYVRSHTTSNAFVAADDPAVADLAGRLVPPPLCDPSNVRLRAGYLSAATLISATQLYRAALVVPSFGIYPQVAGYMRWVGSHYRHASQIEGVPIFARR
jgi:hypothetical protein